jgi:cob(I)alamin adenosyltransferase
VLGVAVSHISKMNHNLPKDVERIQSDLFAIGAYLADPSAQPLKNLPQRILEFEREIDRQTNLLPPLRNFILPGGGKAGAAFHLARTVCRRAERHLVTLTQKEEVDENVMKYLNRLSDLFFSTARFVNHQEKKKETIWSQEGSE